MPRAKGQRNRASRRVPRWESALCVECRKYAREFDGLHKQRRKVIREMLRG